MLYFRERMYYIVLIAVIHLSLVQKCASEDSGVYHLLKYEGRYKRHVDSYITPKGKLLNKSIAMKEERFTNTDKDDVIKDYHLYYNSTSFENGENYFIDLEQPERIPGSNVQMSKQMLLSNHNLALVPVRLKFSFPFYGNLANTVLVAAHGFVSIGPMFHSYINIVHYVAPLMADFKPFRDNSSFVLIASGDDIFIVQWKDFVLNGSDQKFNFEVILHKNGSIVFAYKKIPIPTDMLLNIKPNATTGIADGFILSYLIQIGRKLMYHNYVYSYHNVGIDLDKVKTNAAIKLDLLPNCVQLKNCSDCLDLKKSGVFICRWCERLQLCSDTFDWNRQDWIESGCRETSLSQQDQCQKQPPKNASEFSKTSGSVRSNVWIFVLVSVIILLLIFGVATFFYYAYSHPQSRPGMWLIENRPSRLFKKRTVSLEIHEDQLL